jgi:hypothetical protein
MGHDPQLPRLRAELPRETADLKLPHLSAERKGTLEFMRARIDAFADHLFTAHTIFCETQKRDPGSLESKAAIFNAKQHVESALHELDSTLHLVDLNPEQVLHIATHVRRASHRLSRIKELTDAVLRTKRTTHVTKALDVLALACPRASYELESSLVEPLRRTLTPAHVPEEDAPPALTS